MALHERLRPWYGVLLVVFLAGTTISLGRTETLTTMTTLSAVLSGLFGAVIFQFTVGNVWGYAVEYRNAGGRWSDWPFLCPFVAAGGSGVAVAVVTDSVAAGAWTAFWAFVVVAGLVAVGAWLVVGYRTGASTQ